MGGIAPSDRMGPENSYSIGNQIDPFREVGYLLPGYSPSTIKDSDTANFDNSKIKNIVPYSPNLDVYIIDSGTKIHRITDFDSDAITVADRTLTAGGSHGAHTSLALSDFIIYNVNGTDFGWYSWNDDTDADIGRVSLPNTYDDDFFSSGGNVTNGVVLIKGLPHPMLVYENADKLYIANGRNLISMTSASTPLADMTALQLPFGWIMTTLSQTENYIIIGASHVPTITSLGSPNRPKKSAVFFWDGSSTSWNRFFLVQDNEIHGIRNHNGILYLLTSKRDRGGVLRVFSGTGFEKVTNIHDGAGDDIDFIRGAGETFPGLIDSYRNQIIFGSDTSNIYAYGSQERGSPSGLFNPWRAGTTTQIDNHVTAVRVIKSNKIYAGVSDVTNNKTSLIKLTSGFDTNAIYKSIYYEFPQSVRINYVKCYFKAIEADQTATIKIETNYADTTVTLGTLNNTDDSGREFKRFPCNLNCENFRISIDHDTSSTDAIRFSAIVVDYDVIDDLG